MKIQNLPKKIYLCDLIELQRKNYIIKWIDEWRDELIVFLDKEEQIKIFSSICAHFGGPVFFDKKGDKLICKWHNWMYSSENGKCLNQHIQSSLRSYKFEIKEKDEKNNEKIYAIINE